MKKYNFPILKNVKINHFSLYKKTDYLDIDLTKNVYCLAGANGLGKSTFITIINYALTGIVKNPDRRFSGFNSISSFYNKSKGFASQYFDGRINEENHELAEVTLEFSINDNDYIITRGFFEPDELRLFLKKEKGKDICISDIIKNSELNELYKEHFTKDARLSEFDQFVFLQSFLFTFDETHQLLFWDESLIDRVLHLFFGVNASKAKQADQLRKEINKYDSDVRNLQFQITQTRNHMNSLQKSIETIDLNKSSNIELYETHKALLEKSDELTSELNRISDEIKDNELNIADLSLRASSLRSDYEKVFSQTLIKGTPIERNPKIIEILNDLNIRILIEKDFSDLIDNLVSTIKELQKNSTNNNSEQNFEQLKKIDTQLSDLSIKIKLFQTRKNRFIEQERDFTLELNNISSRKLKIEKDNEDELRSIRTLKSNTGVNEIIKTYKDSIEQLSIQKEEAYKKRNKSKQDLGPLENELNVGYANAEKDFIPKFNQYAKSFLGLEINIELFVSVKGASFFVNIEDTKRKLSFQLSESQRYFIDIAIRMALIELCTNSATILIDTPEGSLDIAYESRAGKMIADFAKDLHKVILTANINSSQLLLELARICKKKRMKLERMTEWTTLSEVQQQETHRIEDAYLRIEKLLG